MTDNDFRINFSRGGAGLGARSTTRPTTGDSDSLRKMSYELERLRMALSTQKVPQQQAEATKAPTLQDKLKDSVNYPILTYAEAAEALHVKPKTIENYVCADKLNRANVPGHVLTSSIVYRLRTPKKKTQ